MNTTYLLDAVKVATEEELNELTAEMYSEGDVADEVLEAIEARRIEIELAASVPTAAIEKFKASGASTAKASTPVKTKEQLLAEVKALRADVMAKIVASTDADVLTTMLVPELDLGTRHTDYVALRADVKVAVQAKLKELTGHKPTSAMMKELFPEARKSKKVKSVSLTHHGVAKRVAAVEDGDLRLNIDLKSWLKWDGLKWNTLREAQLATLVRGTINSVKSEAAMAPDADLDKLDAADSDAFRKGVVGELQTIEAMHVEQVELNTNPRYLAVGNGAVDLATCELVHDRDLLVTMSNPTNYNPEAQCPTFLRVLSEAFEGRDEDIVYYELMMGYSMQANPAERAMFFHKGEGTNGKSLLLSAIMKVLGDYAVSVSYKVIADEPGTTMNTSADAASPALRRLMARRVAYIDEMPLGGNLRDADVKQLAGGGGTIAARGLKEGIVEFPATAVFHIACNNMPTIRQAQTAVWNRTYPVAYLKTFVEDITLSEKLAAESEGILAWLVQCSEKYRAIKAAGQKLRDYMPATAKALLEQMQEEQNPFTAWIEDNCVTGPKVYVSVKDAYRDYIAHHKTVSEDKGKIRSEKAFVTMMKACKVAEHKEQYMPAGRKAAFVGIGLKANVAGLVTVEPIDTSSITTSVDVNSAEYKTAREAREPQPVREAKEEAAKEAAKAAAKAAAEADLF